jgi:hypothetical protein
MLGEKHGSKHVPNTLGSQHWLDRSEQARMVADHLHNPEAQRLMREIAARYEAIARLASAGAAGLTAPPRERK